MTSEQFPPVQLFVHAPAAHLNVQLEPEHELSQVEPASHCIVQPPPEHVCLQVAPALHVKTQPPPEHVKSPSAPDSVVNVQPPVGQATSHVPVRHSHLPVPAPLTHAGSPTLPELPLDPPSLPPSAVAPELPLDPDDDVPELPDDDAPELPLDPDDDPPLDDVPLSFPSTTLVVQPTAMNAPAKSANHEVDRQEAMCPVLLCEVGARSS